MGTSTTDRYHDAAWKGYMETELAQLAQSASGQKRRAIGGVQGETSP
jgi:hypothetical protein